MPDSPDASPARAACPPDGGTTGALIRAHDWAATPLGPMAGWPAALRTLVDFVMHSPLPMSVLWGPDLVQVYNDGYAAICGPRHPAALGRPHRVNWPELQAFTGPVFAEALAGQARSFSRRRSLVERHGRPEEIWLDLSVSPAYDAGRVAGLVVTAIDITGTVRLDAALRENNERFQAFAGAGIAFLMSPDWRQMRQLEGRGVMGDAAMPRRDWMDGYIDADDQVLVREAIARAVRTGEPFELEHRVRRADGTPGWMASRAVALRDDAGNVREWFGIATDITARKHVAEAARQAGQRIDRALDAGAVAGTWYWDVIRDRFTADERFARSFGLDPLQLREGMALAEVSQSIHPDDEAMVAGRIAQALALGGAYRAEYRVRQEGGRYRWMEANGYVTHDPQGRALTFPGVLIDIDERKERDVRQAALLRLGDRLRTVESVEAAAAVAADILGNALGATIAGFGLVDAVAATVTIPNTWRAGADVADVAGVHRLQDYGVCVDALLHGEVVAVPDVATDPRTLPMLASFRGKGVTAILKVPVLDQRGLAGVVLVHQEQARNWSPDEIAFAEGVADRTWAAMARIDAAAALAELNQHLEREVAAATADRNRLWTLSSDIMLVAGFDGRMAAVNPAWTAILGWSEADLLGASLFDLLHPDDLADTLLSARVVEKTGRLASGYTNRYRHRDGSYRWIAWNANKSGDLIVAVGRDVTAERARAATLLDTEDRLRQSLKMEAVGQLTGGLAHDFNNLLASIGGSLELLNLRVKTGKLDDLDRFVGIAQGAVRRAAALTHRLLAFSRRQPLDARVTDTRELVAGMLDLVRRTIGPAIDLQVTSEPGLWPVLADANQLENALLNLCINARDAMPDGGRLGIALDNVTLAPGLAADYDLAPGDYVCLSVADSGTGMAPEIAAKVFEPFFTTKPIGQGTGLGLSMIYGFARQSGGHVYLVSQPGGGTTMHVLLPRHRGAPPGAAVAPAPAAAARPATGARILLVDDEAALHALMAEALSAAGHAVAGAHDAAAALRILEGGAPVDLLVTDIGLAGGMNGRQLAEAARALQPGLRVLFITGYAEARLVGSDSIDASMHLMIKPFELNALARRVAEMTAGA